MKLSFEALRAAGLSNRKVEYAQGLARAIVDGSLKVEALAKMDDQEGDSGNYSNAWFR